MEKLGLNDYISGLNAPLYFPEWDSIHEAAVRDNIPVVSKETARILYILLKLKAPKRVLEIGTGSGYSTLWISRAIGTGAALVTLERDKNRFERAGELLKGIPGITVLYEDAFRFLETTNEKYDAVFLDSQKRDYIALLPLLEKRMAAGSLLLADNILFNGRVLGIDPKDEDKYRDGVELLKKFNEELSNNGNFETLFLPIDDGLAVAVRK